jgi:osmoprotectant transport system substrate-binding protein/osmoprotectant transport system permease protein
VSEQLALLPEYLSAHVRLTLAALAAGIAIAVPAGVLVSRARSLEAPLLGLAGVIQTIPALALLAVMVPLLSGLGLPGIGVLPAFLGLVLYSLLPILQNTVTGLHGVDAAVVEAARAVGMTPGERLWRVELPLAAPVVVAGIRTAAVWTVGMATLSTPVGAPSLGNYIFGGLQTRNSAAVLVGCAAAAALALVLDSLVRMAAIGLKRHRRAPLVGAMAGLMALGSWAWAVGRDPATGPASAPVRIGAKTFTEQFILAEILAGTVRAQTGRAAVTLTSLGSTVAFDALVHDEIDLYVGYTGTLWATVMGRSGAGGSRAEVLAEVRRWLADRYGITLAAALGFENAYCLAVRRETASAYGLARLSDLTAHAPHLTLASDYEFFSREEWRSLERVYHLSFRARRSMDPSLLYEAISKRQVDVITAYSSDGRIEALSLVTLADDRGAIPPYDAVVLAGPRLSREAKDVLAAVARLEGRIDVARMRELNRLVDEEGKTPAAAAAQFLASLPSARGGTESPPPP